MKLLLLLSVLPVKRNLLAMLLRKLRVTTSVKPRNQTLLTLLSGKVSGVQIKQANTMGGSANILIRGNKSLMSNNQALFVIDGVPIDNSITNTDYSDRR